MSEPTPAYDVVVGMRALDLALQRFRRTTAQRHDLVLSDTIAISQLSEAGGRLTARDLADRMDAASGTLTALIDRLVQAGAVVRTPHPSDRRSFYVDLTDTGYALLAEARTQLVDVVEDALPPRERPAAADVMRALADALDRSLDPAGTGPDPA